MALKLRARPAHLRLRAPAPALVAATAFARCSLRRLSDRAVGWTGMDGRARGPFGVGGSVLRLPFSSLLVLLTVVVLLLLLVLFGRRSLLLFS